MYATEIIHAITANARLGMLVKNAVTKPSRLKITAKIKASFGLMSPLGIGRFGSFDFAIVIIVYYH